MSVGVAHTVMAADVDTQPELEKVQLDSIVVSSSRGGVTPTVNRQVIDKSTIYDMKDLLKDQPSISVSSGTPLGQQMYLRGMGESELAFSVDDISSQAQVFHHQSRFLFDPSLLKSMNIEKGTGSASAGIGVTSGAVRMTTVDANDMLPEGKNVGAMIGGSYGDNSGYSASAAVYGRDAAKKFDAIVMGNYTDYDNYEDGHGREIPNTELKQEAYLAKLGWNITPDNRLEFSQRREQFSGDLPGRSNALVANQPIMDKEFTQDTSNLAYTGRNILGRRGVDAKANVFYTKVNDKTHPIANFDPVRDASRWLDGEADAKTTGANASISFPLVGAHEMQTGVNYRNTEIEAYNNGLSRRLKEEKEEVGAFAEAYWDFDPVSITTGVRYDHYDLEIVNGDKYSEGVFSPSIAATWQATNNLAFNASWSQAIQSPKLYEAMFLGLPSGVVHELTDDIKAGKAQTSEVGFEWRHDKGWMVSASVYEQRIKDYISILPTTRATFANVGDFKNRGYEVGLGYQNQGVNAFVGVARSMPKLNGETYISAYDSMPTGTKVDAGVSYKFANPNVEVGFKQHYMSKYDYGNGVVLPNYWTTDIFANWQPFGDDRLSLNAGINNIADKFYYSQTNLRSSTGARTTSWYPEKGREFRVGMRVKF